MYSEKSKKRLFLIFLWIACQSAPLPSMSAEAERKVITIGLVFNLSEQAEAVQQVIEGIEMAASDLQAEGTRVRLLKFDSKDTATGTLKATQQAIAAKPDGIIAELDSSKAFVAAEEAEVAKTIMVTPLATSSKITENKKYVFRGTFSDQQQGEALAQFIFKNGSKTAAVVSDVGQLYSQTLAASFKKSFSALGGDILLAEEINPDDKSFRKVLQHLKSKKPDAVFCPFYSQGAARFLFLAKELSITEPTYVGGDAWGQYTQPFRDLIFKERSKKMRVFWAAHFNESSNYKPLKDFVIRYENSTKKTFNVAPAVAYDVTRVLVQAIAKAGGAGVSHEKTAAALRSAPPYKGMTGDFSFDQSNNNRKSVFIVTAKSGRPQVIGESTP